MTICVLSPVVFLLDLVQRAASWQHPASSNPDVVGTAAKSHLPAAFPPTLSVVLIVAVAESDPRKKFVSCLTLSIWIFLAGSDLS